MSHAFDGQSFATLVDRLVRVVDGARDQERRLTRLVAMIETVDPPAVAATELPPTATPGNEMATTTNRCEGIRLLSLLREACIHARQQREIVEFLATSLVGQTGDGYGVAADPGHVLIVDDSQDSRELATLVLEASGFDVATATNGLEGVLFAHYAKPVVILMDINMPVLNGFEAARLLKASPTTRQSQVVAYTAQPDACQGPLGRFFVDVVTKPAPPDLLVRTIQRVLDGTPPVEESKE